MDNQTEDDQEENHKVREESDSTIPDPNQQTVTSTPPVIAPFTDVSSTKLSSLVTSPPINTEATTITTSLPEITPFIAHSAKSVKIGCRNKLDDASLVDLEEFDLKSALFKHMNKIKSANRNTANYHLYHALMEALIADEDAMDKEVADKVKDHKRKHDSDDDEDDDDNEGPSAGSNQDDEQSSKKPRESDASASKQHPALTSTGWQITDTRDAGADSSMHRSDPESEHSEQSSDDIPMQDEGNDSDMEDTDNAHIPKVSTTTWFKPIPESERPATPEPEWTIPPNDFPEPENNWANTYATTYKAPEENKLQRKTYDIGSFIKWFCRRTGKKKLCKADLEGPAFNLVKAFHKNIPKCYDTSLRRFHQVMVIFNHILLQLRIWGNYLLTVNANMTSMRSMASLTGGLEEDFYSQQQSEPLIVKQFRSQSESLCKSSTLCPKTRQDQVFTQQSTLWIRKPALGDQVSLWETYMARIVPTPRAVVYRTEIDQRMLMRLKELHKLVIEKLTRDHLKMEMEMEIPSSSNVKLITECSDTTYTCYEVMKDLIKVSKLPQTLISYSSSQSDDESVDTPLISPFLDSDDKSNDGEVLNELDEYGNAGNFSTVEGLESMARNLVAIVRDVYVFVGNFTYVTDFVVLEDIWEFIVSDIADVVMGRPFRAVT
ncbi:hypothetical protein Tco_1032005 [Tanacetum coccineum]|uniref:Uncharacterized protein n=1 Tax=Tanacetum coccineum TaxID=301880 RepID=A0ABQ5GBD8_9ASTR